MFLLLPLPCKRGAGAVGMLAADGGGVGRREARGVVTAGGDAAVVPRAVAARAGMECH